MSFVGLQSVASSIFPQYFIFIAISIFAFIVLSQIDFRVHEAFGWYYYFFSIVLLLSPLLVGRVTRGTVRWLQFGALTIQPAEIVRPFLVVFIAVYLTRERINIKRAIRATALFLLPVVLIVLQPSLGVAMLTLVSFVGVIVALDFEKKIILYFVGAILAGLPILWFLMAPYQKQRVMTFIDPSADPSGAGYNTLQSVITVGSGKIFGRGLGEGVQTQLLFLPEKHTDFIFASVAEELGFAGAFLLLIGLIVFFMSLVKILGQTNSVAARAYVSGIFLVLFSQTMVHIGMNMGLLPITGVPLPLVSAGGSSLLATMMGLGIVVGARKN